MVRKKEEEIWSIYNLQISIVDYHIIDKYINIAFIFRAQFDIDTSCTLSLLLLRGGLSRTSPPWWGHRYSAPTLGTPDVYKERYDDTVDMSCEPWY